MQQLGHKEEKPNMIWKIIRIGRCCRLIRACLWIEQNSFLMSRLFVQAQNEIWSKLNFFWIRICFYNFLLGVSEWDTLFILIFCTSFRDYWTIFNENLSYSKKKVIHNDLACFTLNLFLSSEINSISLSALLKFNNIKRLKNFTFHLVKFDDAECQCWINSQLRRMSHIQSKWNDKNQVKYLFLNQLVVFFCSAYSMTNVSDEGNK